MNRLAERAPPSVPERASEETDRAPATAEAVPIRRHPGDVVRVVVGGAILALSAAIAGTERLSTFERDLFRLVNHLPSALDIPLIAVMQAGTIAAVPACAAVALATRRPRLARDLAIVGTAAWLLARVVKDIVSRARPDALLSDVILRHATPTGLGFPSGHAAVAAALATAAGPFLPRRARHATWLVVALVAVGRVSRRLALARRRARRRRARVDRGRRAAPRRRSPHGRRDASTGDAGTCIRRLRPGRRGTG